MVAVNPGFGSSHGLQRLLPDAVRGRRAHHAREPRRHARSAARSGVLVSTSTTRPTTSRCPTTRYRFHAQWRQERPTVAVGAAAERQLHGGDEPRRRGELRRARHRRRGPDGRPAPRDQQRRRARLVRRGRRHGRSSTARRGRRRSTARAPRRSSAAARARRSEYAAPYSRLPSDRVARLRRPRRHVPLVRADPIHFSALAPLDDRARAREQLRQRLRVGRVLVPVAARRSARRCLRMRRSRHRLAPPTRMRWRRCAMRRHGFRRSA